MRPQGSLRYRWHAAFLIQRRDLGSIILGLSMYIVLSLSLLASALILRNYLNFVNESGLLVLSDPFRLPFLIVTFLFSLFLALSSVTTISREKDQGTLEVLFYGPVDCFSYILGKYLAQISSYLVAAAIYVCCFILYADLTNLIFPFSMTWVIILSVLTISAAIAFGIFLSTLTGTARAALLLFLGVVLVFVAIQAGHEVLANISPQGRYYNPILFLKNVFSFLNKVANWLSPFSYFNQGMNAVRRSSGISYLVMLLVSAVYSVAFLGLSMVTLERRGVRK